MMNSEAMESEPDEISPEALAALNALLDQGPGEDASEEEVEAFMKKIAETPGGAAMLRTLNEQLAQGGGALLNEVLGQEVPSVDGVTDWSLYRTPQSPLRLVFYAQVTGRRDPHWRRLTLPSDASFYDLHFALEDAFQLSSSAGHRFEWREGQRVEATFLSGTSEVAAGDDYCEYQNKPLDLFSEGASRIFYLQEGEGAAVLQIDIEKLVETDGCDHSRVPLAHCLGGEGPDGGFEPLSLEFRKLSRQ